MSISDENFNNLTNSPADNSQQQGIPAQTFPAAQEVPIQQTAPAQQAGTSTSTRTAPTKGEMFVGLNLLSKIGVIFIIIGAIAFTAVSEDYLSEGIRTIVLFALGLVMAGAGEFFFRKESKVFACALTLGAILELNISVILSYGDFESISDIVGAIIAIAVAAGSVFLSWRYKSQTIMACSIICSGLSALALRDTEAGLFLVLLMLIGMNSAAAIISHKNKWKAIDFVGLYAVMALSIAFFESAQDYFDKPFAATVAVVFLFVISAIYIFALIWDAVKNSGKLSSLEKGKLIAAGIAPAFLSMIFMWTVSKQSAGVPLCVLAVVYITAAVLSNLRYGKTDLLFCFESMALSLFPFIFICFMSAKWAAIAFLAYGAVLACVGIYIERKLYKIWGYVVLVISQPIFWIFFLVAQVSAVQELQTSILLHFAINTVALIALMILLAKRSRQGALLTIYSTAVAFNTAFFLLYALCTRLIGELGEALMLDGDEINLYRQMCAAVIWLICGFIVSKLSFMKTASDVVAIVFYVIGLLVLTAGNVTVGTDDIESVFATVLTVVINAVSVLVVLDIIRRVESISGKAAKSVALIVTAYSLYALTVVLGTNDWVAFTSCIISIIYIAMAVFWIIYGFIKDKPLTRRFGLALSLLACAKLFLFDFSNINEMGRTLMFIGFGITLLIISFVYGYFETKAKKQQ